MTLACCPNCGLDFAKAEPVTVGDLSIDPIGDVIWKGKPVRLTPAEHMIVMTLARTSGRFLKPDAIINIIGSATLDHNVVAVLMCRIRRHFRDVDPTFAMIENRYSTNEFGGGYRWRVD